MKSSKNILYLEDYMKTKILIIVFFALLSVLSFSVEKDEKYLESQLRFKRNLSFSLDYNQAKEIIQKYYPQLKSDEEILQFIKDKKIQKYEINGEMFYFDGLEPNLLYRDLELNKKQEGWGKDYRVFIDSFFSNYYHEKIDITDFKSEYSPYFNPKEYFVEYSIYVDKDKLPDKGHLKLWTPLPLQTACQEDINIIKIEPVEAVIGYPKTTGDIGYINFDLDLEKYDSLDISVMYSFKHYQQEFIVDLDEIGEYDRESELYKIYTESSKNIFYNDEMKDLALSIVGNETNPYLMAKKIYYYVVDNIYYSLIAHAYLEAEKIPESLAVFEHGYGDCGAQSMFFSALCRSLGIPARATGGFQIFFNNLGDHFWAEFYLPNYGWVPVDTSVGKIGKYAYWISEEERDKFIEFYFGNQDPLRMVVQNNVDVAPDEVPEDIQILSLVLQKIPYIDVDYGNENDEVSLEIIENVEIKTYFIK